jgi:hypothetical protein
MNKSKNLIEIYNPKNELEPNQNCEFCKRDIEIISLNRNINNENN